MVLFGHPLLRLRLPLLSPGEEEAGGAGGTGTEVVTPAPEVTPAPTTPPPPGPVTFSQEELNRRIGMARAEGRKQAQDEAKKKAEEDEAARKGEWERLAGDRQAEIDALKAQLAERDRDLLVAKVAAKHKLPPEIADRLKGQTEEDLDADAKALAKVVASRTAPDTEAGVGKDTATIRNDRPVPKRQEGPVYAFDGVTPKVPWPNR